jgi:sigma-B regulation protein RsbU (phosphoserine phosphatase)
VENGRCHYSNPGPRACTVPANGRGATRSGRSRGITPRRGLHAAFKRLQAGIPAAPRSHGRGLTWLSSVISIASIIYALGIESKHFPGPARVPRWVNAPGVRVSWPNGSSAEPFRKSASSRIYDIFIIKMKVLIAEDDPVVAKVLRVALQCLGHQLAMTRSGSEAWAAFEREPPRLIVSDWRMPGLDALEFCRKVRGRHNPLYPYFILLTAPGTSAETHERAISAGVDAFLSKPLHHATVQTRLRVAERMLQRRNEGVQLKALVPICGWCHRVRREDGAWERAEAYLGQCTGAIFTHGLCPACFEREIAKLGPSTQAEGGGSCGPSS